MRVLHLGKFYPPHPGGIERFTADLACAQQRSGVQPAVIAHCGGVRPEQVVDDGFPVRLVRSHGKLLFVPVSPDWIRQFRLMLAGFRPQLLHVHLPNPSAFWMLGLPAARALPWVLHWHADVPEDARHAGLRLAYPLYRQFERRMLRQASRVVATSNRYLHASKPLQPHVDRTRVVPLGIDEAPTPAVTPPAWPAGGLRLLAVGRLSYYKGFGVLLDALARVEGASLLLVGDGELERPLRQRIEACGLGQRVRMLGRADDATLEAAYRSCDLLCLPSLDRAEAFGLVLLEAMRAGKPVLAADIPGSGVGEVVVDGVSGRLVPPGDIDEWAGALADFVRRPEQCRALGEHGYRRWSERFRIGPVSDAITTIYRELLANRSTG